MKTKIKINREELLNGLRNFALEDSGMVIGNPGVGKSYTLRHLKNKLIREKTLCFLFKIENVTDFSDKSISTELGLSGDTHWIDALNSIGSIQKNKYVLIFDGFDAVREEDKRQSFLKQLKIAKDALREKWNILVSVRTYDAEKSPELNRLFLDYNKTGHFSDPRKFVIDKLSENEIIGSLKNDNPFIYNTFKNISKELQDILKVPFFLKLLTSILSDENDSTSIEEVYLFKHETQLLDMYWKKVINQNYDSHAKIRILTTVTKALIENKSLTLSLNKVIEKIDANSMKTFNELLSDNVLEEVSINKSRIGFSHNILFDYAVSRICWEYDYDSIIEFINQDYSRAFFLRPSFIYTFSTIWVQDFPTFIEVYNQFNANKEVQINLFFKLIINSTIATHYENNDQIKDLLQSGSTEDFIDKVKDLLQSLRFIRQQILNKDIELIEFLSQELRPEFLYEFAFVLEMAIEQQRFKDDIRCGISARNFLFYILESRNGNDTAYYDRIGSTKGINLVIKTIKTGIEETSGFIYNVLEFIDNENFEIQYFFNITNLINYIIDASPELAKVIYEKIYIHVESSTEKTMMAGGPVMSFYSNRKQDFELCQYNLENYFPAFLNKSPHLALETGLNIINNRVIKFELPFIKAEPNESKIISDDTEYSIITDYSFLWADNSISRVEKITESIVSYLVELLQQKETVKVQALVKHYMNHAKVAYLWKILFRICADFPNELSESILPIITNPFILNSLDLTFDLRNFLENAAALIPDNTIIEIESVISEYHQMEGYDNITNNLFSLPIERLSTDFAKQFIATNKRSDNEKPVTYSSSFSNYSTEEFLKDKGVDTVKNSGLILKIKELENFCSKYLNAKPTVELYKSQLIESFRLWDILMEKPNLDDELVNQMRYSISHTLAICARNLDGLDDENFSKLKEIVINNYSFISKNDLNKELSAGAGYSPTPRIFASEAFLPIYRQKEDYDILDLYNKALNQENSIVRLNCIKDLKSFSKINSNFYRDTLYHILNTESNAFNYSVALSNIIYDDGTELLNYDDILKIINGRSKELLNNSQFATAYSVLLLNLFEIFRSREIRRNLAFAYDNPSLAKNIIFNIFKTIDPRDIKEHTLIFEKLEIIYYYLHRAFDDLGSNQSTPKNSNFETNAFIIIDQIVMRLNFTFVGRTSHLGNKITFLKTQDVLSIYDLISPIITLLIDESTKIGDSGFIQGHTAHYLMQTLNAFLPADPKNILSMVAKVTKSAFNTGYTFDQLAIKEIVSITEKLLADHRQILLEEDSFNDLITIYDIHLKSGWVDILQLLWRMDEVFK